MYSRIMSQSAWKKNMEEKTKQIYQAIRRIDMDLENPEVTDAHKSDIQRKKEDLQRELSQLAYGVNGGKRRNSKKSRKGKRSSMRKKRSFSRKNK